MVAFSLITLAARGPISDNKKWLGWGKRNEWAVRKPKPRKVEDDQEMGIKASQENKLTEQPGDKPGVTAEAAQGEPDIRAADR